MKDLTFRNPSTLGTKLALGAGALLAAKTTHAALVMSSTVGAGLTPPGAAGTNWDVDGDATPDFQLVNSGSTTVVAKFIDANGGRLVVPSGAANGGILKLSSGFVVKATGMAGAKFHTVSQVNNLITVGNTAIGVDANAGGWALGDTGYFGFKFDISGQTHYGYGTMTIDKALGAGSLAAGRGFTITSAFYESTPNTAVVVPEPGSLALLALGALAAAGRRRRRVAA